MRELSALSCDRRRDLEGRLASTASAIDRAVDALLSGTPSRALQARLAELETTRDAIEAEIATLATPAVEFYPKAGLVFCDRVRDLKVALALADEDNKADAFERIRAIVEKIMIHPRGTKKPADFEIHGQLAALLHLSEGAVTSPSSDRRALVAGTCNHLKLLFEAAG